ncbi:MAG: T9SS type A sorting domain-containing protein, partial [Ignavibacteria bacterium]
GEFKLYQNYPNPFNASSKLKFQISNFAYIILKVFDVLGREIEILVNEFKNPGTYELNFNGSRLSSGLYFYQLLADGNIINTKKMIYLK